MHFSKWFSGVHSRRYDTSYHKPGTYMHGNFFGWRSSKKTQHFLQKTMRRAHCLLLPAPVALNRAPEVRGSNSDPKVAARRNSGKQRNPATTHPFVQPLFFLSVDYSNFFHFPLYIYLHVPSLRHPIHLAFVSTTCI